jgi:hypothetical protein
MQTLLALLMAVPMLRADPEIINLRESVRTWALTCPNSTEYSHADRACAQGDATMFNGLGCLAATLAGDEQTALARCQDVATAQGEEGRWYRGPRLVGKPYPGSFSRDQSRGVFAYLTSAIASPGGGRLPVAQSQALSWLNWVDTSEFRGMLCEKWSRCRLTPGVHNLFYNVYRHLGVLPGASSSVVASEARRSRWYATLGFGLELRGMRLAARTDGKWYPVHIKASDILIQRVLNLTNGKVRNPRMARRWSARAKFIQNMDPNNLLYQFLRYGANDHLKANILKWAPREKPDPGPTYCNEIACIHDWSWHRHSSEHLGWKRSDGWDWIYLINLYLAKKQGALPW